MMLQHPKVRIIKIFGTSSPAEVFIQRTSEPNLAKI